MDTKHESRILSTIHSLDYLGVTDIYGTKIHSTRGSFKAIQNHPPLLEVRLDYFFGPTSPKQLIGCQQIQSRR